MVTVGFLVFGVINVTQTVAAARDLGAVLQEVFAEQGLGRFTNTAAANGVGWAVIAVNVLALVLAIFFSVPRLRLHRTTFWIPLVCAAGSLLITTGLMVGIAVSDPAFMAGIASR